MYFIEPSHHILSPQPIITPTLLNHLVKQDIFETMYFAAMESSHPIHPVNPLYTPCQPPHRTLLPLNPSYKFILLNRIFSRPCTLLRWSHPTLLTTHSHTSHHTLHLILPCPTSLIISVCQSGHF